MATRIQNFQFAFMGIRPATLIELRCRPVAITGRSVHSANGELSGIHPSPLTPVIRRIRMFAQSKLGSLRNLMVDHSGQLFDAMLRRLIASSLEPQPGPLDTTSRTVVSDIAAKKHRTHLRFMVSGTPGPISYRQFANPSFEDDVNLEHRAGDYFAQNLPIQGSRKNKHHMRQLFRAFNSPIGRQQRKMNQYEENYVNQRIAIRREPDCDRRR